MGVVVAIAGRFLPLGGGLILIIELRIAALSGSVR